MKRFLMLLLAMASILVGAAQNVNSNQVFHTYIYNDEYKVYMDVNLYEANISVPGQDVFGTVPGFFGALRDSRKWLVTDAKIVGKNKAELEIINDYGSEDLTATLTYNPKDNTYVLKQTGGSRLKIVVNRKWLKIPTEIVLAPHKRMADMW
ncbi:hypothetical protein [uncultured Prevotella sp.]|uniref:hypothetical protein n=3 Tax=Prevotella TaxID=838 RepID=UPI0025D18E03|nr:hypothetical protein [uncultured Prevotella sp.]MDY3968356.1 hypothetical protein [Prevotella sp.]